MKQGGITMRCKHDLCRKLTGWLAVVCLMLGAGSCMDEYPPEGTDGTVTGKDVTVKLAVDVTVPESVASTRVPADNVVFDLYVLIFDVAGNKTGGGFFTDLDNEPETDQPDTTGDDNYVTIDTKTGPSYIYGFANVNGSVNEYADNILEKLNSIETRDQLLELSATLDESVERVGNSYLMSGTAENQTDGTYVIREDEDIRTLKLRRLDSYITFRIEVGEDCTFRPSGYRVFNVPRKVYLVEREATHEPGVACTWDATIEGNEDNPGFFDTGEIGGMLAADMSFSFWMVENRRNAKREIAGGVDGYSLREKEEKTENGSDLKPTVTNGSYVYAPDEGTYVVVNGNFTGQSTAEGYEGAVQAEVSYTIHLGYVDGDADDFFSNRNTKYTYTMTVNGVNNIILEVVADTPDVEPNPGAEGDVIFTEGTTRYSLDSHYETVLLRFDRTLLEHGAESDASSFFSYRIKTPFASYLSTDRNISVRDEDWVRFVRNEKGRNGRYSEDFQPYALRGGNRNGMTLEEFMQELRDIAEGKENNAYDNNDEVVYTCHIDEFYYDEVPSVSVTGDLWKHFVNVSPRELQILNDVELSPDGESSITRSTYILSQRAIQTFFNTDLTESYSAYGVETVNETGPLYSWHYYINREDNSYIGVRAENRDTGHSNFWSMLADGLMHRGGDSWNTYVDFTGNGYKDVEEGTQTVNAMRGDYQRAYLACMQRNRDLDGDGNIDEDEIRWYLPAINQYVGMFIGDGSLSEEAKLYTETQYVYKHYISSTTNGINPVIYWAEEGVSESQGREYNMAEYRSDDGTLKYTDYSRGDGDGYGVQEEEGNKNVVKQYVNHYRCMRDLGDKDPVSFYSYDQSKRSITIPYLDRQSTRGQVRFGELGNHENDDGESELYSGGFTYYENLTTGYSDNQGHWIGIDIGDVIDNAYTACRYIGNVNGRWRAPNLRELYLMSIVDGDVLSNAAVSRTKFRFWDTPLPNTTNRYRLGWFYNGANVTMGNGNRTEGDRIRCVRDN